MVADGPDVLFVGHGAERSGPPIYLAHLQRWLAEHTELSVATLLPRGGPLVEVYEGFGPVGVTGDTALPVEVVLRGLRRTGRPELASRIEDRRTAGVVGPLGRPRLVYANTVAPTTAGLVRSVVGADTVLVVHVHELMSTLRHRIARPDLDWLLGRADRIVTASRAVQDQLVAGFGVDVDRTAVCYEFVEPVEPLAADVRGEVRASLAVPDGSFLVAGSGRIDWRKAPELLAQALWRLRWDRPELDARAVWVGAGGDDRWQLEHDLATMGLEGAFVLAGERARLGANAAARVHAHHTVEVGAARVYEELAPLLA